MSEFVERIEALEAERRVLDARILEAYGEAGERGLHVGALQEVVDLRRPQAVRDTNALIDGRIRRAAALFNQSRTVKQVAETMGIGNGTAGRLRQAAEKLGLILGGAPAAVVVDKPAGDDIPSQPKPFAIDPAHVGPTISVRSPEWWIWKPPS